MDTNALIQTTTATLIAVAWKIAGAVLLWLIGRWLIGFGVSMLRRALAAQHFDATLSSYLQTGVSMLLNVALIVAGPGQGPSVSTPIVMAPPGASVNDVTAPPQAMKPHSEPVRLPATSAPPPSCTIASSVGSPPPLVEAANTKLLTSSGSARRVQTTGTLVEPSVAVPVSLSPETAPLSPMAAPIP